MRALIRDKGETVLESYNIPCIDWNTGAPLTNREWSGGPYVLVNDYVPTADEDFAEEPEIVTAPAPAETEETVTIDGKEYTREELLALLNQTH